MYNFVYKYPTFATPDIWCSIMHRLNLSNLLNLRLSCKNFAYLVNKFGIGSIKVNSHERALLVITLIKNIKLCIENCENFNDNGIKGLINLTSLKLLNNNQITDNGIKGLINLTTLDLWNNNQITDNGIKGLINLTSTQSS